MAGIDTPMVFENLRDTIEALLISFSTGRFQVKSEQVQSYGAEESEGTLRIVQVFYSDGDYNEARSTRKFSAHDCTFEINYIASEPSTADLSVINNPLSTPAELATAIAAATDGTRIVNKSIDTLRRMISQIILDPVNNQLGLPQINGKNQVANPRLTNFRKDQINDTGILATVTASERLTVRVQESFVGATPAVAVQPAIELTNEFNTLTDPDGADPAISGADITTSTP